MTLPSMAEVRRSLGGAWMLFWGRSEGLNVLDTSIDGFWRSFGVILLLAPMTGIVALTEIRLLQAAGSIPVDQFPIVTVAAWKGVVLALDWVTFPLLLAAGARPLGVTRTYVPYVVARNWAAPIAMVISLIPGILLASGMISDALGSLGFLFAIGLVVRYHYVIARIALKVPIAIAIAIVVLDLVLGLLINEVVITLAGL